MTRLIPSILPALSLADVLRASALIAFLLTASLAVAQPDPPPNPDPVPVDGGLGLLALAGAGYAARKLKAHRCTS